VDEWAAAVTAALRIDCVTVRREYTLGLEWQAFGLDRIDLVISGPDFVIAIENKRLFRVSCG